MSEDDVDPPEREPEIRVRCEYKGDNKWWVGVLVNGNSTRDTTQVISGREETAKVAQKLLEETRDRLNQGPLDFEVTEET